MNTVTYDMIPHPHNSSGKKRKEKKAQLEASVCITKALLGPFPLLAVGKMVGKRTNFHTWLQTEESAVFSLSCKSKTSSSNKTLFYFTIVLNCIVLDKVSQ